MPEPWMEEAVVEALELARSSNEAVNERDLREAIGIGEGDRLAVSLDGRELFTATPSDGRSSSEVPSDRAP